jgi:hypothetical protein
MHLELRRFSTLNGHLLNQSRLFNIQNFFQSLNQILASLATEPNSGQNSQNNTITTWFE